MLRENAAGLVLASSDKNILENLAGRVKRLYAAVIPTDIRAVNTGKKFNISFAFLDNSIFFESEKRGLITF
jgi:DNA polymerase-3 subunit alpha/error-prone DNA polymerase